MGKPTTNMANFKTGRGRTALIAGAVFALFHLPACTTTEAATTELMASTLAPGEEYTGRIRLTRILDEPDGYCLDVPGPASNVMLQFPLVAHTCHADPLADQVFRFNDSGSGQIRWTMDEYDLCFTADSADNLANLNLKACEGSPMQTFEYTAPIVWHIALRPC